MNGPARYPARRSGRILIIKPSSLGDIVHALPVLAALRRACPRAAIAWLVARPFAPLLRDHPLLDEVIVFERARYGRLWRSARLCGEFLGFVRGLRRRRFELVIDLQGLIRSAFLALASGAPRRIGFADARELAPFCYTQRVRCPAGVRHAVERNLCLLAALDLKLGRPEFPLGLRPAEVDAARARLRAAAGRRLDSFSALVPGARWETKRWPAQRIAALIGRMWAEGLPPCVLLGSPADRPFAERILAECRVPVIDLVGRTGLRELVALLHLAERVICHDSGPLHIAAALRKPLVAIFGPTDPRRTGPYAGPARVIATPVECAPCQRRTCDHHSCMRQLAVETVLAQVRRLDDEIPRPAARLVSS